MLLTTTAVKKDKKQNRRSESDTADAMRKDRKNIITALCETQTPSSQ